MISLQNFIFPIVLKALLYGHLQALQLAGEFFYIVRIIKIKNLLIRCEIENHQVAEKGQQIRRAPSLSGPLNLPNRASANSLSAPIKSSGGDYFYFSCHAITKLQVCMTKYRTAFHFFSFRFQGFKDSLEDKSKTNLVQIKGRFSVTSENVDLVKVQLHCHGI